MKFEEKLEIYAELLVAHGMNVQPGQAVNITAEIVHRELVDKMVRVAYRRGAKFVNVDFVDPELQRLRIAESQKEEYLSYVPVATPFKYESFVEENVCVIRIVGSEAPDNLADLPADRVNMAQTSLRRSLRKYYTEGIGKSKIQWTVAAAATPAWAKKIYPELPEKEAYETLWEAIFHICRADKKNCLELWQQHQVKLETRAKKLTDLKIEELHFTGPGTDLKVFLSPKAIFMAGGHKTTRGVQFEANIPTEECFTTPDYRKTTGRVRVTRPVPVNGELVKGLELEFVDGDIVNFTAEKGASKFAAYISNDPGAKRLGEVALVGIDSPIYQNGRMFEEILYDENAACHIAIGMAYRFCLEGGAELTNEELHELGCNDSPLHTDFMISSDEVDVQAKTYAGEVLQIIKKGSWVI